VGSIGIIVADPTSDPGSCLAAALKGIEEDAFVFQRATTIHRYADIGVLQGVGKDKAGELRALIRVEALYSCATPTRDEQAQRPDSSVA